MTTRDEWLALSARAEAATGADDELDAEVARLALAPAGSKIERSPINGALCIYEPTTYGREPFRLWDRWPADFRRNHAFTASTDAMHALIGETLPGWGYEADSGFEGHFWTLREDNGFGARSGTGRGATPALAMVSAYCKARASLGEEGS